MFVSMVSGVGLSAKVSNVGIVLMGGERQTGYSSGQLMASRCHRL